MLCKYIVFSLLPKHFNIFFFQGNPFLDQLFGGGGAGRLFGGGGPMMGPGGGIVIQGPATRYANYENSIMVTFAVT